jgi:hypothetical protein
MSPVLFSRVVWLAVLLAAVAGCGSGSGPESGPKRSTAEGTRKLPTEKLPKLGDYLPPLDKDRLELAPPEGWHVPSASRQYIVRVQKSAKEKYPSVTVTAEDYEDQGIQNVSEENVKQFAAQVADAVNKDKSAVQPRRIGGFVGVAYAKRAKIRQPVTRILDVLYLETVVGGRKYRFELRSEEGSLDTDRPYLYAVANGTRFLEAASEAKHEPAPAPEPEAKEKPAKDAEPDQPDQQGPEPKAEQKPGEKAKEKPGEDESPELDLDKLDELIK